MTDKSKDPRSYIEGQPVLERVIESYLKDSVQAIGGLAYKFESVANGVPDQIIIYNGNIHLVEVKRPGGALRPSQVHVHKEINKRDVPVYVVSDHREVDRWIQDVLGISNPLREPTKKSHPPTNNEPVIMDMLSVIDDSTKTN